MAKKVNRDKIWFDEFQEIDVTNDNIREIADILDGVFDQGPVKVSFYIQTPRGRLNIRIGDRLAVDQIGRMHIVSHKTVDKVEDFEKILNGTTE